ncbi:MAG: preprotein translocase subunit SecE [Patescibacteria group bacterium]|nr:preprotein translocase subunit SecE [Patescibacteria group bacterium]
MSVLKKIKQYIAEVKSEAKKVSWPTRKTALKDSFMVIVASLTTAVFLGGVDYLLSYLINEFVV